MYHANAAAALRPASPYGLPLASPSMFRSPFHPNLAHLVSAAASAGSPTDPGRSPSDRGASRGGNPSSLPHHGGLKQEKSDKSQQQHSPSKQHHAVSAAAAAAHHNKEPHIKKPLNAFMLYMKEMRPVVQAECTLKESAAINQILGRRVSERAGSVTIRSIPVVRVIVNVTNFVASALGQKKFINQRGVWYKGGQKRVNIMSPSAGFSQFTQVGARRAIDKAICEDGAHSQVSLRHCRIFKKS